MLRLVLRRMMSSKWMVLCLLLGSIMAAAIVSCIPIYSDGILQRMLTRDLETFQLDSGMYPGSYHVGGNFFYTYEGENRAKAYKYFDSKLRNGMAEAFGLPLLAGKVEIRTVPFRLFLPEAENNKQAERKYGELGTILGAENHIVMTRGRVPSASADHGVYEVMITDKAMKNLNLLLDRVFIAAVTSDKGAVRLKFKPVGIFAYKDERDPFWNRSIAEYGRTLVFNAELFSGELIGKQASLISTAEWYYALDYHQINLQNIAQITAIYQEQLKWEQKYAGPIDLNMPAVQILQKYQERSRQLKTTLWVLTVPILLMLAFYVFMVSQLIVIHDENSIAVLKSRGAGALQIFFSYLLESVLVGAAALLAGPPIGLSLCSLLGSSNGFLEFVQRTALPVHLSQTAYLYTLIAVTGMTVTMLIPVILRSRTTIVLHKQSKARGAGASFWKKYYLDLVVVAISAYGIYRFEQQQKILQKTGIKAGELDIDPLLFLTSTLFVLGAGLLFLRLYPYLIRLIYWLGRRIWSPVLYVSLIQVGRSRGQEQFLMLFIILAISTGIFNANSARTINRNVEDKIRYSIGADIALQEVWRTSKYTLNAPGDMPGGGPGQGSAAAGGKEIIKYHEPDFRKYPAMDGVEAVTRVLVANDGRMMKNGQSTGNITVMGIIPEEFAKVAWFRPDLMKHHWYQYLNLMVDAPRAFILSKNLKDAYGVNKGDTIQVTWGDQGYLEGMVYEFVDYWPTYNPNKRDDGKDAPGLIVANLSYIRSMMALQPYEVWIKKKPGTPDKQTNDEFIRQGTELLKISYTNQQMVRMKNDPMLQGTNGALTLGFIAAMLISALGFLIYWIISIQSRILHFGILRAMGMSMTRVIGILACEQILISGAAVIAGLLIGGVAADSFIPLLQIMYSSAEQVPPFRVIALREDYLKIYAVIASMLAVGFGALGRIISRIRIDQAVKLGED